jgi:uncharacterized surface protein with fasciclin (FAS1) repeats
MKKLFLLLLVSTFVFQSCDDDNDVEKMDKTNTIVDVAVNAELTSLVAAVTRADLAGILSEPGAKTVLAPTNTAFAEFLTANGFDSVDDVPVDLLRNILLNHVIDGKLASTDLSTGYANTMATSDASSTPMSIYVNTSDGVKFNGESSVLTPNVNADNGIVHVVDKVIGLPTVVTFAVADPNFSILVQALTREESFTYVATLSTANGTSPAPFTVFAPVNDAFVSLLDELDFENLGAIPAETLASTLNTHVIASANAVSSGLTDGATLTTLGGELIVNTTGSQPTLTDSKDRVSTIIAVDVQANNGVIHAIDKVVLE